MTYRNAVGALLKNGIENAEHEAALLFLEIAHRDSLWLRMNADTEITSPELERALSRRLSREPLQHILGKWYFWREEYEVSRDCLIPRADSELIVEYAIDHLPQGARFLDLCTGSGCLAISTLASRHDCTAIAVDISDAALSLARRNAARNGVEDRIEFICSDILASPPLNDLGSFDAIISNPPYIPTRDLSTLSPELAYEPRIALDGGDDGLIFYRRILDAYRGRLNDGGVFIFEIGYDQGDSLRTLGGHGTSIHKDFGKNDRMAIIYK